MQIFAVKYSEEFPFITSSHTGKYYAFCKICRQNFKINHGGRTDIVYYRNDQIMIQSWEIITFCTKCGTSNNSLLPILDLLNFSWRKQMSSHHYVSPYWLVNTSNSDHSDWHISQVVLNSLTCWKFIASYMRKSSFMRKKSSSKW